MEGEVGLRSIKLLCSSASKLLQITASENQKIDIGSISRAFGLDPNTLKLNGHFISRGIDLIATSVTWKSLIGFFSDRNLSTGVNDSDPLLVDGKPSKMNTKRFVEMGECDSCEAKKPRLGLSCLLNDDTSGGIIENGWGLKRRLQEEDKSYLKRRKISETDPGETDCSGILGNDLGLKRSLQEEDKLSEEKEAH